MDILKEKLKEKITSAVNDIEQILPKKDVISLLKELSFYFDMKADEVEKDLNENGERTFEKLRVNQLKSVNVNTLKSFSASKLVSASNYTEIPVDEVCCEANEECCAVDYTYCDSDWIVRGNING